MKTKSIVATLVVMMTAAIITLAGDPGDPRMVVVNQKGTGIFKVIYEGQKKVDVTVSIFSKDGKKVFAETIRKVDGFIRPLNFNGMEAGLYTIEIADASGKTIQSVNYNTDSPVTKVHVAKIADEGKYLLSLPSEGKGEINVKIFDGENNLVHNQDLTVTGDFGLVYNLKQVAGVPTFEVTDQTGNVKRIR